jgi:hypothetical protein
MQGLNEFMFDRSQNSTGQNTETNSSLMGNEISDEKDENLISQPSFRKNF